MWRLENSNIVGLNLFHLNVGSGGHTQVVRFLWHLSAWPGIFLEKNFLLELFGQVTTVLYLVDSMYFL